MVEKNLEKIIQQLKDALPLIEKKIDYFKEIADRIGDAFSSSDIYDKLLNKIAERKEQEEALEQLTEAILRIDQIFKNKQWSRELVVLRKSYDVARIKLLHNIDKIQNAMNNIAKKRIPDSLRNIGSELWMICDKYLVGSTIGHDMVFNNKNTVFLFYKKIENNVDGNKKAFIVLSQEFDNTIKKLRYPTVSVFPMRFIKPPYEEGNGTWFIRNAKVDIKDAKAIRAIHPKSISTLRSFDRILGLLDFYKMSSLISKRPSTNTFKATPSAIAKLKSCEWFLTANEDKRRGPVIGKDPVLVLPIRAEYLEGKEAYKGKIYKPSLNKIIVDVKELYSKRKNLKINIEEIKKIDDPTMEDPYVYRLQFRFYEPGILEFAYKVK